MFFFLLWFLCFRLFIVFLFCFCVYMLFLWFQFVQFCFCKFLYVFGALHLVRLHCCFVLVLFSSGMVVKMVYFFLLCFERVSNLNERLLFDLFIMLNITLSTCFDKIAKLTINIQLFNFFFLFFNSFALTRLHIC